MSSSSTLQEGKGIVALVNVDETTSSLLTECDFAGASVMKFANGVDLTTRWSKENLNICTIISQGEIISPDGIFLLETLQNSKFTDVPYFIIANKITENLSKLCIRAGVADIFQLPVKKDEVSTRVNFLIKYWPSLKSKVRPEKIDVYKIPFAKRLFDIFFSSMAIIMLSPILLLIIILMKIESKGPVFYYSLRVGTGYKIFKFYKLRSMYVNADKRLKDLVHLNQYGSKENLPDWLNSNILCDDCVKNGTVCQRVLYADNNAWCEKNYISHRKALAGSAFIKLKNDPRITKIGRFLRNTSIDELPQLWNVFIGDMSIVGNRPLPLYEAEKLTTDKYALRFKAPSGITGLWQVEKRGKGEMSEEERLQLDNAYAENHSFISDLKLILKTIPALFQKENV
ncbi:MAG: sugar transferase [Flavipsychrobacter sp.]|jgi:lipopolysaccharide/colanic/teichoic acid biosynthesis glycosyltransferase|nr:sugar transferase [Flavipsychrobacter sp.]